MNTENNHAKLITFLKQHRPYIKAQLIIELSSFCTKEQLQKIEITQSDIISFLHSRLSTEFKEQFEIFDHPSKSFLDYHKHFLLYLTAIKTNFVI